MSGYMCSISLALLVATAATTSCLRSNRAAEKDPIIATAPTPSKELEEGHSNALKDKEKPYRGRLLAMTGDDRVPVKVWNANGNPVLDPYYALGKKGLALVGRDYSLRLDGGHFFSAGAEEYLGAGLRGAESALTLSAFLDPATLNQNSTGCIIGYGPKHGEMLFALRQEKDTLTFSINAPNSSIMELSKLKSTKPFHLVLSAGKKAIAFYINGKLSKTYPGLNGNFSTWKDGRLFFGNNESGTQPWRGRLERVALYNKALGPAEAKKAADDVLEDVRLIGPVPSITFRGTLLERSTYPMPWKEGFTYREVLSVCEYQVNKVIRGAYKKEKIRVAEWVYVDRIFLTNCRKKIGTEYELEVEMLNENPQLSTTERADTLELDMDADTYYSLNRLVVLPKSAWPKPPKKEK